MYERNVLIIVTNNTNFVTSSRTILRRIFLLLNLIMVVQTNIQAQISFSADNWIQIDDPSMKEYDVYKMTEVEGYDHNSSMILKSNSNESFVFKWKKESDTKTFFSFYFNGKPIERCNSNSWVALSEPIKIKTGDELKWEFLSQRNRPVGPAWVAIPKGKQPSNITYLLSDPSGNQIVGLKDKNIYLKGQYNALHIINSSNLSIYAEGDVEIDSNDNAVLSVENSDKIRIYDLIVAGGKYANIQIENSSDCLFNNIMLKEISNYGFYSYNNSDIVLDSNIINMGNSIKTFGVYVEGTYSNFTLINNIFSILQNSSIIGVVQSTLSKEKNIDIYGNNTIRDLSINKTARVSIFEGNINCSIFNGSYCCKELVEYIDLVEKSNNTWGILKKWSCNYDD